MTELLTTVADEFGVAALILVAGSVAALLVLRRRRLTATAPTSDFAPGKDRR